MGSKARTQDVIDVHIECYNRIMIEMLKKWSGLTALIVLFVGLISTVSSTLQTVARVDGTEIPKIKENISQNKDNIYSIKESLARIEALQESTNQSIQRIEEKVN